MRFTRTAATAALALALVAATAGSGGAEAAGGGEKVRVVATLPNLGAIAQEVGGDRIDLTVIASGLQDAHFVDPKPSYIVKLRSADLLLVNGLDLEIGWVPPLTQGSRNAKIAPGGTGYVDCSDRIGVLEIPAGPLSRAQGDVHPFGNPHYLTDPLNAEIVAGRIAGALALAQPASAGWFETRRADFVKRLHVAMFGAELVDLAGGSKLSRMARSGELDAFLSAPAEGGRPMGARLGGWLGRMRPLAGLKIVTYHRDFTYFARRFALDVVDHVEPKPGIPPSARHLAELTERLMTGDIGLLVTRPYVEHRSTDRLAERTGVPVVTLPLEVGGAPAATGYLPLIDHVVERIAAVARAPGAGR